MVRSVERFNLILQVYGSFVGNECKKRIDGNRFLIEVNERKKDIDGELVT